MRPDLNPRPAQRPRLAAPFWDWSASYKDRVLEVPDDAALQAMGSSVFAEVKALEQFIQEYCCPIIAGITHETSERHMQLTTLAIDLALHNETDLTVVTAYFLA